MIRRRRGTVVAVAAERPGAVELSVDVDGEGPARAIAYPAIVGPVRSGDRVLLNTTAVWLGLGTGGSHFVMAVLPPGPPGRPDPPDPMDGEAARGDGRTMKLRYTPDQVRVRSVEEPGGGHEAVLAAAADLGATPVVWIPLHSMVGPVTAGALAAGASTVAYVMTDGAALPAALSRLAARLRGEGLLDRVITAGQAFGGDIEAVNVFTGLLAARHVAGADVIVVGDGPGNLGTGTPWGATAIQSAMSLNTAAILDGRPVAALRVSFADPRERHRVVSHHSITALARVALAPVHVAVPAVEDESRRAALWDALRAAGIDGRHQLVEVNGRPALDLLTDRSITVESMGRGPEDDPEFFLAAGAAGVLAGRMAVTGRPWRPGPAG